MTREYKSAQGSPYVSNYALQLHVFLQVRTKCNPKRSYHGRSSTFLFGLTTGWSALSKVCFTKHQTMHKCTPRCENSTVLHTLVPGPQTSTCQSQRRVENQTKPLGDWWMERSRAGKTVLRHTQTPAKCSYCYKPTCTRVTGAHCKVCTEWINQRPRVVLNTNHLGTNDITYQRTWMGQSVAYFSCWMNLYGIDKASFISNVSLGSCERKLHSGCEANNYSLAWEYFFYFFILNGHAHVSDRFQSP